MTFPKKCLGYPPFLGYICWPEVVGALLLLLAPLPYFLSGVPAIIYMTVRGIAHDIPRRASESPNSASDALHFWDIFVRLR